jgi:hypothetical protein
MEAFAEGAKAGSVETAALGKSMRQHVLSAASNARFRLSQAETGLFTARNAIRIKDLKDQEETGTDSIEKQYFAAIFFFY